MWTKANVDIKFQYWKIMQHNYDVLEKEECKQPECNYDMSNESQNASYYKSEEISGDLNDIESNEIKNIINFHKNPQ